MIQIITLKNVQSNWTPKQIQEMIDSFIQNKPDLGAAWLWNLMMPPTDGKKYALEAESEAWVEETKGTVMQVNGQLQQILSLVCCGMILM